MKKWTILVMLAVIALAIVPLVVAGGAEFGGADGEAETAITEIDAGYEPWFSSIWEPPSGEIESLLFALQAAIGSGLLFFALGYYAGRAKGRAQAAGEKGAGTQASAGAGRFAPGLHRSVVNTIDRIAYSNRLAGRSAVEKTVLALGMLVAALALPSWPGGLVVLAVMLVATLAVARVPLRTYAKLVLGPLTFLVIGVAPLLVSIDFGGPWLIELQWAPGGVETAVGVTLRSLAAVSCLFFLSMTTPVPQVLRVLRRMRVPAVLTEVSLIIYRDVWVFVDTVRSIRAAQASRLGYSSLRTSYRSLGMLLATFFGQTLQRARSMESGLKARNWQGEIRVLDEGAAASVPGISVVAVVLTLTVAVSLAAAWAI